MILFLSIILGGNQPCACNGVTTAGSPNQGIFKSSKSTVPQVDKPQWTEDSKTPSPQTEPACNFSANDAATAWASGNLIQV